MYPVHNKPIVFFEKLSPRIATESLKAYLSKQYQVESCEILSIQGKIYLTFTINRTKYF